MNRVMDRVWIVGAACVCAAPAWAAEWSVTPAFATVADHSSNRVLRAGAAPSESLSVAVDLLVARQSEAGGLTVAPHARIRRFSDDVQPDADDYRLAASLRQDFERGELRLDCRVADESTLTTELAETGLVRTGSSRRTVAADAAWSLSQAEARRLDAAFSHEDVDYRGAARGLFGYRFDSASVSETFVMSPRLSLAPGAFASRLDSPERGSRSREEGASLALRFEMTEHTTIAATIGASRRDINGHEGGGATRSLTVEHRAETSRWSFEYSHRLVPYGSGVLTEQDSAALSLTRDLAPRWRSLSRAGAVRNRDGGFGITFEDRTYRFAETVLEWSAAEHWSVGAIAGYSGAEDLASAGVVNGWSFGLQSRWNPAPRVLGH